MKKKLFALSFFVCLVGLIEACFCRDVRPYFDYHKLQISYGAHVIGTDTTQSFYITLDSIDYVASNYQLTLTPSAFGTNCPTEGELGAKYAASNFEIFADKDFNDTLKAGKSLSTIFYSHYALDSTQNVLQTLLQWPLYPEIATLIYTPYLPTDTAQVFEMTIRITKSNGSVAEGKLGGIKFN
ncbi:MAG: hypothetical protein Q7U74_05030 [Saprospiraceae bacterium]|nr:hypothetical protein [Saprospiraceae bacterium]